MGTCRRHMAQVPMIGAHSLAQVVEAPAPHFRIAATSAAGTPHRRIMAPTNCRVVSFTFRVFKLLGGEWVHFWIISTTSPCRPEAASLDMPKYRWQSFSDASMATAFVWGTFVTKESPLERPWTAAGSCPEDAR